MRSSLLSASPRSSSRRPDRKRSGFTILEVALAAAIMAMGISTAIVVMQRGFAMLDSARNITTAGQILVSEMEQLRMNDWTTVSAYEAGPTTMTIASSFTSNSSVGSRFALTRTVATVGTDVIQITLRISWRNYDGRTIARDMTTYYARYGIHDYFYNHT